MTALRGIKRASVPLRATSPVPITNPWQLANGTIPPANVVYFKQFPAQGEQVTGALPLTNAWTIAFRVPIALGQYPSTDALVWSVESEAHWFGNNNGLWSIKRPNASPEQVNWNYGNVCYFLITDGVVTALYRNNSFVRLWQGATGSYDLLSNFRWRSASDGSSMYWTLELPAVAIYNINISVLQLSNLVLRMLALPAAP